MHKLNIAQCAYALSIVQCHLKKICYKYVINTTPKDDLFIATSKTSIIVQAYVGIHSQN